MVAFRNLKLLTRSITFLFTTFRSIEDGRHRQHRHNNLQRKTKQKNTTSNITAITITNKYSSRRLSTMVEWKRVTTDPPLNVYWLSEYTCLVKMPFKRQICTAEGRDVKSACVMLILLPEKKRKKKRKKKLFTITVHV